MTDHNVNTDASGTYPSDPLSTSSSLPVQTDPQIPLTLLLVSGKRRAMTFPENTTVARVKELIWATWPPEWDEAEKPPAPGFLRLLHLGKVWVDESTLNELRLARSPEPPAVAHVSIRPFMPPGEDSSQTKKSKRSRRHEMEVTGADTEGQGTAGGWCRCVIC